MIINQMTNKNFDVDKTIINNSNESNKGLNEETPILELEKEEKSEADINVEQGDEISQLP